MRYLFTTLPTDDLGLLARALPVAHEMKARGHEVAFCAPSPSAPAKVIAEAGFENLRPKHPMYYISSRELNLPGILRAIKSQEVKRDFANPLSFVSKLVHVMPWSTAPWRFTSDMWNLDHFTALNGASANYARSEAEALMTVMTNWQADAVVDFWNLYACIAARAANKPLITIIQSDLHPQSGGFIWWKQPPSRLPTPLPVFNKILADYNLPSIHKTGNLLTGDLTLVVGMPETDPLPPTAKVTYIGPLVWQRGDVKTPDWFDSLHKDKPVIWLYPGNPRYMPFANPYDSAVVTRACIAALSNEDVQVVLSTGHQPLPDDVLPLPANFIHKPFVPASAMAQRCNLMIHHGGYGSCQTGLYCGTPQLIIPTMSERESNARRVAAAGAGDFIVPISDSKGKKKRIPIEELRAKVKKVLNDPSYAANAIRMSDKLRSYGGAPEAARLIENLKTRISA